MSKFHMYLTALAAVLVAVSQTTIPLIDHADPVLDVLAVAIAFFVQRGVKS